jgi:hypothetical protein
MALVNDEEREVLKEPLVSPCYGLDAAKDNLFATGFHAKACRIDPRIFSNHMKLCMILLN